MTTETVHIPDTAQELAHAPRGKSTISDNNFGPGRPARRWELPIGIGRLVDVMKFSTADAIAAYFRQEGIKGDRSVLQSCPIANLATQIINLPVEIDDDGINFNYDHQSFRVHATPAMKEFIRKFDEGYYPDLVR